MTMWFEGHHIFITLAYGISFASIAITSVIIAVRARKTQQKIKELDALARRKNTPL